MSEETIGLLEQIRKSAATGRNFADNPYDTNRYGEILDLLRQLAYSTLGVRFDELDPIDNVGYITPKVGVNGIIENADKEILLEMRKDDLCWGIPGGWAEVGLTAEENLKKEMLEETGYEVAIDRLVGVMSRKPSTNYPFSSYHLIFKCSIVSGSLQTSYESESVAWSDVKKIEHWHMDHNEWIEYYYASEKG